MSNILRGWRGHSLIEAITVLALIALLVASASPTVSRSARRYAAWSAARELRGELVAARTRAVLGGVTVRVVVDTLRSAYRVVGAESDTLRIRRLSPGLFLRTTAVRQEILFTARGTSSLYSTTWIGVTGDPDARWHGTRVAPTGAVLEL